jgi:hypothetical protein
MILMRAGKRYVCQNRSCRAEILVMKDSTQGDSNPRCCCGADMNRHYTKPVIRELDKGAAETVWATVSRN